MREVIIIDIESQNGQELKDFLKQKSFFYRVYQESEQDWKAQEKKALQEWQNLSDEQLITEWENLPNNENVSTDNWN